MKEWKSAEELNEMKASNLSDTAFKTIVIRILMELSASPNKR